MLPWFAASHHVCRRSERSRSEVRVLRVLALRIPTILLKKESHGRTKPAAQTNPV